MDNKYKILESISKNNSNEINFFDKKKTTSIPNNSVNTINPSAPLEENIYPNLEEELTKIENFSFQFSNKFKLNLANHIFDSHYVHKLTLEQKTEFDDLLNIKSHLSYDPDIFQKSDNIYPPSVKFLYYTMETPKEDIKRLSKTTNIYLNQYFAKQNTCSMFRIMYYPIYYLMNLNKGKDFNQKNIFDFFINSQNIKNYGQLDVFYDKEEIIINDYTYNNIPIIKFKIDNIQPTDIEYKNHFDYIPICHLPYDNMTHLTLTPTYPTNLENNIVSDICFHNDNCHDYWCKTHNYHSKQSILRSHFHYTNQPLVTFKEKQKIHIKPE